MTYPAAGVPSPSVPSTLSGLWSEIMRVNLPDRDGVGSSLSRSAHVCSEEKTLPVF